MDFFLACFHGKCWNVGRTAAINLSLGKKPMLVACVSVLQNPPTLKKVQIGTKSKSARFVWIVSEKISYDLHEYLNKSQ